VRNVSNSGQLIGQAVRLSDKLLKWGARVTLPLEQQVLTKERLEKHVQGFANWAKGGLKGLIDVAKAQDALLAKIKSVRNLATLRKAKTHKI